MLKDVHSNSNDSLSRDIDLLHLPTENLLEIKELIMYRALTNIEDDFYFTDGSQVKNNKEVSKESKKRSFTELNDT